MRYLGQNYELELPIAAERFAAANDGAALGAFHEAHKARFGFSIPGEIIEIVNFIGDGRVARPAKPELQRCRGGEGARSRGEPRSVCSSAARVDTPVFERADLGRARRSRARPSSRRRPRSPSSIPATDARRRSARTLCIDRRLTAGDCPCASQRTASTSRNISNVPIAACWFMGTGTSGNSRGKKAIFCSDWCVQWAPAARRREGYFRLPIVQPSMPIEKRAVH